MFVFSCVVILYLFTLFITETAVCTNFQEISRGQHRAVSGMLLASEVMTESNSCKLPLQDSYFTYTTLPLFICYHVVQSHFSKFATTIAKLIGSEMCLLSELLSFVSLSFSPRDFVFPHVSSDKPRYGCRVKICHVSILFQNKSGPSGCISFWPKLKSVLYHIYCCCNVYQVQSAMKQKIPSRFYVSLLVPVFRAKEI